MRIGQSRRTMMLRLSPLAMLLGLALLVGIGSGRAHAELTASELLQACEQIEAHGQIDGPMANIPDTATAGLCLGFFSAVLGVNLYANTEEFAQGLHRHRWHEARPDEPVGDEIGQPCCSCGPARP